MSQNTRTPAEAQLAGKYLYRNKYYNIQRLMSVLLDVWSVFLRNLEMPLEWVYLAVL